MLHHIVSVGTRWLREMSPGLQKTYLGSPHSLFMAQKESRPQLLQPPTHCGWEDDLGKRISKCVGEALQVWKKDPSTQGHGKRKKTREEVEDKGGGGGQRRMCGYLATGGSTT